MTQSKISKYQPRTTYTTIEGLSETRRLPRAGKIRLGIKVKKKAPDTRCTHPTEEICLYCSYPRDTDYFVCPPEIQEVYGPKPKELDIFLPCEDPGLFFPQALKWYKGNRLMCKGNKRLATRIDEATGNMFEMECPCEHFTGIFEDGTTCKKDCSEKASLMVLLPKVSFSRCYQIDTGSKNAIIEINSYLEWLMGAVYRVSFVPLKLVREMETIQYTDPKQGQKTTEKSIVKIMLPLNTDILMLAKLRGQDYIAIEGQEVKITPALPPAPQENGADEAPGGVVLEENGEEVPFPEEGGSVQPEEEPDTDGQAIEEAAPAEVEPEGEPEKAPPKPSPGPKITPSRLNILRALFLSKGIAEEGKMDELILEKFGTKCSDLSNADYSAAKDAVAALGGKK